MSKTFIKYGSDPEKDRLVDSNSIYDRLESVWNNYGIDKLINDPVVEIRLAIAYSGFEIEALADDLSPNVRCAVASQGHFLPKLVFDKNAQVRRSVAYFHNFGLDYLYYDLNEDVREVVIYNMHIYGCNTIEEWKIKFPDRCINIKHNVVEEFLYNLIDSASDMFYLDTESDNKTYLCFENREKIAKFTRVKHGAAMHVSTFLSFADGEVFEYDKIIQKQIDLDDFIIQLVTIFNDYEDTKKYGKILLDCLI